MTKRGSLPCSATSGKVALFERSRLGALPARLTNRKVFCQGFKASWLNILPTAKQYCHSSCFRHHMRACITHFPRRPPSFQSLRSGLKMRAADACLVYVQQLRGALGAQTAALCGLCQPKTAHSIVHSSWYQCFLQLAPVLTLCKAP